MRRPQKDSVQAQALDFYALNRGASIGHDRPHINLEEPTEDRPTTPRASASGTQQVRNPEAENILIPPSRVVCEVEPGPDTAALIAQNMAADKETCEDAEALESRGVRTEEHIYEDESQVSARESCRATAQRTNGKKARDISQDDDPDYYSESTSEGEDPKWRIRELYDKYVKRLRDALLKQEEDGRIIDKLKRRNWKLKKHIEEQEHKISVLEDHSNQLEEKYNRTQALLRKERSNAAELKNDVARLCNAIPEMRDDEYFNIKFSGIFLSVESWVLQYFMASAMESPRSYSLPEDLKKGLVGLWGENWKTFLFGDTVHTIEAVAIFIIREHLFESRILGIVGELFQTIEGHFRSCSVNEVNEWRMNTIRMILADKEFPARFEQRVCEVTERIENLLGPLAATTSNPKKASARRMRRLKAIVEQAARLALECSQEPSTFRFHTYLPEFECLPTYMTDADRTVDDDNLGADGACVKFTVSPAVLRVPDGVGDELILLTKARVVRHIRPPPEAENTCVEPGDVSCGITGTELDRAFGSGSS